MYSREQKSLIQYAQRNQRILETLGIDRLFIMNNLAYIKLDNGKQFSCDEDRLAQWVADELRAQYPRLTQGTLLDHLHVNNGGGEQ